jgi:hypothetical protein
MKVSAYVAQIAPPPSLVYWQIYVQKLVRLFEKSRNGRVIRNGMYAKMVGYCSEYWAKVGSYIDPKLVPKKEYEYHSDFGTPKSED